MLLHKEFTLAFVQLSKAGGFASRAVDSFHGEKRSEGAAQGHEPELAGQGVPAVSGTPNTHHNMRNQADIQGVLCSTCSVWAAHRKSTWMCVCLL